MTDFWDDLPDFPQYEAAKNYLDVFYLQFGPLAPSGEMASESLDRAIEELEEELFELDPALHSRIMAHCLKAGVEMIDIVRAFER